MLSLLYFDVEDSISPPGAGCDDIVLAIAEELSRRGIKGSFHVIGDKARSLEARGRNDVIRAVTAHDVSSHFDHGSVHPNTVESVATADWDSGVEVTIQNEGPGFADIERIFGRCGGLTCHGGSYAPQIVHGAGRLGKPYYGVPFELPGHPVFRFCGNLVFSMVGLVIDEKADSSRCPGYIEADLGSRLRFGRALREVAPAASDCARQRDFAAFFGCHPHRLLMSQFACENYFGGMNAAEPRPPTPWPRRRQARIWRDFLRYLDVLAELDEVEFLGLSDLALRFGGSAQRVTRVHLRRYVDRVQDSAAPPLDSHFSPAELLVAIAEGLLHSEAGRGLPEELETRDTLGPLCAPAREEARHLRVDHATAMELARSLVAGARRGALPARVAVGDREFSPSSALAVLACYWSKRDRDKDAIAVDVAIPEPCPDMAGDWAARTEKLREWPVLASDLDFGRIVEHTRLQTWSAKPAHPVDVSPSI
jgi:hypothetical protein